MQVSDENRLSGPGRTRNSPSPRTVKYNPPKYNRPHKPASPINIIRSHRLSPDYGYGNPTSSPRSSAQQKMVLREVDELNDELAEIYDIHDNIDQKMSVIYVDDKYDAMLRGNKPGDLKHMGTPPHSTPPQVR